MNPMSEAHVNRKQVIGYGQILRLSQIRRLNKIVHLGFFNFITGGKVKRACADKRDNKLR